MAPRIWAESTLDCWAEAAVKRQKRLQNKKSFMRIAIVLPESSSIPCRAARFENGRRLKRRRSTHGLSHAGRMCSGSAAIKFGGNQAQPAQLGAKLFDHEFDHPDGFMKAMAHFL